MLRRNLLLACLLGSAVAQTSVSQTQSPTGSTTPSATATPTTSATPSITQTASASGTRTASQFRTASQSTSASQTQTQSITPPPVLEFGGGFLPSNWSIAPGFPSPTFVSVSTELPRCCACRVSYDSRIQDWCGVPGAATYLAGGGLVFSGSTAALPSGSSPASMTFWVTTSTQSEAAIFEYGGGGGFTHGRFAAFLRSPSNIGFVGENNDCG